MFKVLQEKDDLFVLENKKLLDVFDEREYKKQARKISRETHVPIDLIYYYPFRDYVDNWYKFDNEWYYFKRFNTNSKFFNELLGELVSKYFDLDTVEYKLTKAITPIETEYGISSKNFCDKKSFCLTCLDFDFSKKVNDLLSLSNLEKLKEYTKDEENYKKLLIKLKAFLIRDLYTSQMDRAYMNFLFKENKGEISLAPLFDYEDSFGTPHTYYRNQIVLLSLESEETKKVLKDSTFQSLLNKMMLIDIKKLIEELEDRHKIVMPEDYKDYYKKYDEDIKKKVLDTKVIK